MRTLKIAIGSVWVLFTAGVMSLQVFSPVVGQTRRPVDNAHETRLPDLQLVDRFDDAIQKRFLTMPSFGMGRLVPVRPVHPPSSHISQFSPVNDVERNSVADLEKAGWKVGLYLFGRESRLKDEKAAASGFRVTYHLNPALAITGNVKKNQLPKAKKLLEEVKTAFIAFQNPAVAPLSDRRFTIGEWSYVARPVRASSESCLQCHSDYVITEQTAQGSYKFRKRTIGDANGVLVYAFARTNAANH